ncbi:MAG: glycosyltransferase family 4 protein [Deferrisomatales bacterium]|nr:glycosyltransferase family 4 protein [Deferrisomatales bacterium]
MRRKRVLHMAHIRWFNAEAQYALDLALEMQRGGVHVVFFGQTGSPGVARARRAGLEVAEEAGFNGKGLGALRAVPAAVRLLRRLRRQRFDAVEVHRSEALPLVALACRLAGVPVVRVRGDMRPVRADPLNRFLYRSVLSGVVASNDAIAGDLKRRFRLGSRVRTIHGGVNEQVFCPEGPRADVRTELGFPQDAFLVGILGRIGSIKGHGDFLTAARQVSQERNELRFVILDKSQEPGGDVLRAQVASDTLLRGRVGFLGHQEDLPVVLRAFDLGVVASVGSEANCRVGLEWMACGVPLLATRIGVLPDLVEEAQTGYLVPPASASALAEKIVYLARQPAEVRRLGSAARRRVLERFTLAHCAAAHEAFIRELVPR